MFTSYAAGGVLCVVVDDNSMIHYLYVWNRITHHRCCTDIVLL